MPVNRDDIGEHPTQRLPPEKGPSAKTPAEAAGGPESPVFNADPMLGQRVGNIRLVEELGSGGMGTVYRAVDEKLGRTVAVKAIRAGQMLDGEARARFLREAQVLSRLNHPHICQVYDYVEGAENDYLVLELVKGRSLRQVVTETIPRLQALRIAEQLADVLTVTHSRGVIHRDLKPENVMLTDKGDVKVLDFGLARQEQEVGSNPPWIAPAEGDARAKAAASVSTVQTVLGTVVGTIGYMSPEQARGEAALPPSDIYSLGLLLQELFTGRTPYDVGSTAEQLLLAASAGVSRPVEGLPSEVGQLIESMKAAAAEERPTAPEVAERLRWIIDKPRRRVRWTVAAVAVVAIVGGSAKYAVDLNRERTAALEARSEALVAREDAEELMGFILQDLYEGLVPVGRLDLLEQVARQALDYYRPGAEGESLTDEGLRRRSLALRNLGGVFADQGELEQAAEAYQGSLIIAEDLVVRDSGDLEAIFGVARAHAGLAGVQKMRDDPDGALASYELAVQHNRTVIAAEPTNGMWRRSLADTYSVQGSLLYTAGRREEALEVLRKAVTITQILVEETPDDTALKLHLGTKYRALSQVLAAQGDPEAARRASDEDLALCTAVARGDASNANAQLALLENYTWRGRLFLGEGNPVAAQEALRSAVRVGERLVADDPSNTHWQFRLSASYVYFGEALLASGKKREALGAYEGALKLMRAIAVLDETNAYYLNDLAYTCLQVGNVRAALGEHGEARAAWREGARVVAAVADEDGLPPIQETYAQALLLLGRVDEARPVIRRVLDSGWPLDPKTAELCRKHGIEVKAKAESSPD